MLNPTGQFFNPYICRAEPDYLGGTWHDRGTCETREAVTAPRSPSPNRPASRRRRGGVAGPVPRHGCGRPGHLRRPRYLSPGALLARAVRAAILALPFSSRGGQEPPPAVVVRGRVDGSGGSPAPTWCPATPAPVPGRHVRVGGGRRRRPVHRRARAEHRQPAAPRFLNGASVDLAGMDVEVIDKVWRPSRAHASGRVAHRRGVARSPRPRPGVRGRLHRTGRRRTGRTRWPPQRTMPPGSPPCRPRRGGPSTSATCC